MRKVAMLLTAAVGLFALVNVAQATVLRVVVVETSDLSGYMADVGKIQGVMKRLGSKAVLRIWRARFAGSEAGSVVVSIEYPDMAAYAADDAKAWGDSEYQSLLKGLDQKRKILSDSLYDELK